jgi:Dihydrofolate reductase
MSLPLSLVVAMAENRVIGRDNGLVWRIKSDLQYFKAQTIGRPVIMGRQTPNDGAVPTSILSAIESFVGAAKEGTGCECAFNQEQDEELREVNT